MRQVIEAAAALTALALLAPLGCSDTEIDPSPPSEDGTLPASTSDASSPSDSTDGSKDSGGGTKAPGDLEDAGGGGDDAGTSVSTYDDVVLSDKPVAFWDMTANAASEPDLTGQGHTGTYKGGQPKTTTMPNGDAAAIFNGTSHYLTVPSSAAFSIPTTKQLTWEAWIRPDTLQFPVSKGGYIDWMGKCASYSPTCEWEARMYNATNAQNRYNRISAYVFNSSAGLGSAADWQPTQFLLKAGEWLHVVGEYQTISTPGTCSATYPGSISIWVNGVEWNQAKHNPTGCMSQYKVTPQSSTSPVNIGTMALDSFFQGAIGKVAIYGTLLTQNQITSHYRAMTGRSPSGSCAATCSFP